MRILTIDRLPEGETLEGAFTAVHAVGAKEKEVADSALIEKTQQACPEADTLLGARYQVHESSDGDNYFYVTATPVTTRILGS